VSLQPESAVAAAMLARRARRRIVRGCDARSKDVPTDHGWQGRRSRAAIGGDR
jgi:hypothetical protein